MDAERAIIGVDWSRPAGPDDTPFIIHRQGRRFPQLGPRRCWDRKKSDMDLTVRRRMSDGWRWGCWVQRWICRVGRHAVSRATLLPVSSSRIHRCLPPVTHRSITMTTATYPLISILAIPWNAIWFKAQSIGQRVPSTYIESGWIDAIMTCKCL